MSAAPSSGSSESRPTQMVDHPVLAARGDETLVVVGASLAGLRAVEGARAAGFKGRVVLVGDEPDPPYDRPPLSKAFMMGDTDDTSFDLAALIGGEHPVEMLLGTRATGLDLAGHRLLTDARPIDFDKMVIATGAAPRALPGLPDLRGIHYLRSRADAVALRRAVAARTRVVVLGGGFIGAELSSSFRSIGAAVTLVEAAEVPLARAFGCITGREVAALHEMNGVDLRCGAEVAEVVGDGDVRAVILSDGQVIEADVLVVGIGARPATRWLGGSGLELDESDGAIICDEHLASSAADIWAAGDVVSWPSRIAGRRIRLENWTNATQQGSVAGRNAVGVSPVPYDTVPYAWTDWYGQRIQVVGRTDRTERTDLLRYGSVDEGRMVTIYRDEDRVVGAVTVNEPGRIMKLRRLIMAGADVSAAVAIADRAGVSVT